MLFQRPLLQSFVICGATDPLAGLFIIKERDSSAKALVILSHQLGIDLIMPDLKLRHLYPLLILQPLHERLYMLAVGSLSTGKLQEIKLLFRHKASSFLLMNKASEISFAMGK